MPIYDVQVSPPTGLRLRGAIFPVEISMPQVLIDHLTSQGVSIPQPVHGPALVDTGASVSVVDVSILRNLNISPIGVASVSTTAGIAQQNLYPARFRLPRIVIDISAVLGADLSSYGIIALIGRDILSGFLMIYHGPAGRITLVH